jgi:peptidoglycan/xylan/chitin deacetylase (PgdA/CDA1 family)
MKKAVLTAILTAAKSVGLFALARRLTAGDLRILCYHGAALRDEHHFSPGLFMSKETFAARMEFLSRQGYPVISLDAAVDGLKEGAWPRGATVITIDDGWLGTYKVMGPILQAQRFPATLYIASYYLEKQTQVFNVAANYVLWRARDRRLDLSQVSDALSGDFELADPGQRAEARRVLNDFADGLDGATARQDLFRRLCGVLGVDAAEIERERICAFVRVDEARELRDGGVDIQLHSHRHRFLPESFELAKAEIEDNRRVLAPVGPGPLRHFCYPSGDYETAQLGWLDSLGIVSATTIKGGFTRAGDSPYELRRFLDSERVSPLEFEAEMCGFFELVRRCGYAI